MITLQLVFFILAIVFFGLVAFGVPGVGRVNFLGLGLMFFALGILNIKIN